METIICHKAGLIAFVAIMTLFIAGCIASITAKELDAKACTPSSSIDCDEPRETEGARPE